MGFVCGYLTSCGSFLLAAFLCGPLLYIFPKSYYMKKGQIVILLSKFLHKMRLSVAPDYVLCNGAWHRPWRSD